MINVEINVIFEARVAWFLLQLVQNLFMQVYEILFIIFFLKISNNLLFHYQSYRTENKKWILRNFYGVISRIFQRCCIEMVEMHLLHRHNA